MSGGVKSKPVAIRLPDWLDARVEPPSAVSAFGLKPLPAGDNRRHDHDGLVLVCDEDGMHLELLDGSRRTKLFVDFLDGVLQHRAKIQQARAEMLVRACGVPNDGSRWTVVDATAGLGRDAFLLATCGADVTLVERHPLLAMLLEHALDTLAAEIPDVAVRLHLREHDAIDFLRSLLADERPDVVCCDPMFPPRTKSAAVSGEMQVLHALIGETPDGGALLAAALRAARRRVVVKRPLRAPPLVAEGLEHIHPSYALEGRASRLDVYLIETLPL